MPLESSYENDEDEFEGEYIEMEYYCRESEKSSDNDYMITYLMDGDDHQ